MKSEKISINDFNISLTLSKEEAKQLFGILNYFVNDNTCPIADGIINELRQYNLFEQPVNDENKAITAFIYKNKMGEESVRRIEIHSIRAKNNEDIYIMGMDLIENETRTFLYSGMSKIFINGKPYSNIYEIGRALYKINPKISFSGFRVRLF